MEKHFIDSFEKIETTEFTAQKMVSDQLFTRLLKTEILKIREEIVLAEEALKLILLAHESNTVQKENILTVNRQSININADLFDLNGQRIGIPVGTVIAYAGNRIPNGWLMCNGATITEREYPILFQLIGAKLPALTGNFIMGTNGSIQNKSEGEPVKKISWSNMPQITLGVINVGVDGTTINTNDNGNGVNYIVRNGYYSKVNSIQANSIGVTNPLPLALNPDHIKLCYLIKAK